MTRQSQKELERSHVKEFLKAIKLDAQIEPGPSDNTSPDCFLKFNDGKRIWLEHTRYTSSERLKAGEEAWKKIRESFHNKRTDALLRVDGQVFFKNLLEFPKRHQYQKFVDELLAFCLSLCPQLSEKRQEFGSFDSTFPLLNSYIDSIGLWIWDERHDEPLASNYDCGMIDLSEDCLLEVLNKKGRVSRCKNVAEYWLVIVSALDMSQSTGLLVVNKLNGFNKVNKKLLSMQYTCVYIFSKFHDGVVPCWNQARKKWEKVEPTNFQKEDDHE